MTTKNCPYLAAFEALTSVTSNLSTSKARTTSYLASPYREMIKAHVESCLSKALPLGGRKVKSTTESASSWCPFRQETLSCFYARGQIEHPILLLSSSTFARKASERPRDLFPLQGRSGRPRSGFKSWRVQVCHIDRPFPTWLTS